MELAASGAKTSKIRRPGRLKRQSASRLPIAVSVVLGYSRRPLSTGARPVGGTSPLKLIVLSFPPRSPGMPLDVQRGLPRHDGAVALSAVHIPPWPPAWSRARVPRRRHGPRTIVDRRSANSDGAPSGDGRSAKGFREQACATTPDSARTRPRNLKSAGAPPVAAGTPKASRARAAESWAAEAAGRSEAG